MHGLNYAEIAEKLFPKTHHFGDATNEESYLDPTILICSIQRTKARSCLILGNTYLATIYVQKALSKLGVELIYFFGVYNLSEFKRILGKYSLLYAEEITKVISILSQSVLSTKIYAVALKMLKIEFKALSEYPTDFLQVLAFMLSSFQCKIEMQSRRFSALQRNTLKICRSRLQSYEVFANLVEIQTIGKAYLTIIGANLKKNRLKIARSIGKDAVKFLNYVKDYTCAPHLYVLLIEINLFEKKYKNCWEYLDNLSTFIEDDTDFEIYAHYHCFLATLSILDGQGQLMDKKKKIWARENVKRCKKFATKWTRDSVLTVREEMAFYFSSKILAWCQEVETDWAEKDVILDRCFNITEELYERQDKNSYWNIKAAFVFFRSKISMRSLTDLEFMFTKLTNMKKDIELYFPVYKKEYFELLNFVREHLNTVQL